MIEEKEEFMEEEISEEQEEKFNDKRESAKHVIERIRKAKNAVGDRNIEHQELMAFYEGKQYQLSKYRVSRPWVVRMRTPYASSAVDTRVSSLIASDYRGELLPMSPEQSDSITTLKNFMQDEWERMNLNTKIDECIKASAVTRESYLHITWVDEPLGSGKAKRDGYIDGYQIDQPSSVYIDPTALSLRDARYVGVLNRMNYDDFKETYPEYAKAVKPNQGGFTSEDRGELGLIKDYEIEQQDVMTVITFYERIEGIIHKSIVVEDILVDEDRLDGLHTFPLAQMRWKRASASPYGLSLMDEVIDLQKAINAIESAITNTAVAYSAPSYAVRKGSGINPKEVAKTSGVPGLVFSVEGDVKNAIMPIPVPQLDQSIMGVKNDFIMAIDRIAGITNPYLGSIGTAGNTAQGSRMAIERARIIEADVLHNIELFIEDITMILIDYISAQYAGEDIISRKVDRTSGEVEFTEHKLPSDLEDLKFTFFVNLNTKTSYSKEREKEMLLELYQMQHQYKDEIKLITQLDIIESYDLSNREALVQRFKTLVQQTNEEKAELIASLVESAKGVGLPVEAVQEAIVELLSGQAETPITDRLLAQIQQMSQEQQARQEQAMQQFTQGVTEAGVSPQAIQQIQQQMAGGASQEGPSVGGMVPTGDSGEEPIM